jgi:hypothetical protein
MHWPRVDEEDHIQMVVYEELMRQNGSYLQEETAAYFLVAASNPEKEPRPFVQACFAKCTPSVYPGSRAATAKDVNYVKPPDRRRRRYEVFHRETGKPALILYITEIEWLSPDRVRVQGGYYEGRLSSTGERFWLVRRKDGNWLLYKRQLIWIS